MRAAPTGLRRTRRLSTPGRVAKRSRSGNAQDSEAAELDPSRSTATGTTDAGVGGAHRRTRVTVRDSRESRGLRKRTPRPRRDGAIAQTDLALPVQPPLQDERIPV